MNKSTRLRIVIMTLKIFGWSWIIIILAGSALSLPNANFLDDIPRTLGQIFGILFILSPGIAALYWARK